MLKQLFSLARRSNMLVSHNIKLKTFLRHWDNFTLAQMDCPNNFSAIIIPIDQESTLIPLKLGVRNTSGAVYFGVLKQNSYLNQSCV